MNISSKPQIAVWQPYFLGGGAEAVALWILEALIPEYDVTLYTLADISLPWLDSMYSTELAPKNVQIKTQVPNWLRSFAYFLISNNKMLRMFFIYWSIRQFKESSHHHDVLFSAFNALDMGQPGIQYLHWEHVVEKKKEKAEPWLKVFMKWVDFSYDRLGKNFSIANSEFTAQRVEKAYGVQAEVIYPPVTTEIDALPWHEKENAFLCSGRIVRNKQTHRAITILKAVREAGFDVKLHITGGSGGAYAQKYLKEVQQLAKENADWVFLHQNLPYSEYLKIMASCRYGIHYKPEPFGISVAEMMKAGMIPFVRSKGGQMEIVGSEQTEILFLDEPDCVKKVIQVLGDESLQQTILQTLDERKKLFSTERFMDEIRTTVKHYLEPA